MVKGNNLLQEEGFHFQESEQEVKKVVSIEKMAERHVMQDTFTLTCIDFNFR